MRRLTGLALAVVLVVVVRSRGAGPVGVPGRGRGVRVRRVRARTTRRRSPRTASSWTVGGCWRRRRWWARAAGVRGGPDAGRDGAGRPLPRGRLVRPDGRSLSRTGSRRFGPQRHPGVGPASDRIAGLAAERRSCPSTRRPSGMRPMGRAMGSAPMGPPITARRTRGFTGAIEPIVGPRHPAGPVFESLSGGSGRSLGVSGGYNGWGPSVRRDIRTREGRRRMRGHSSWKRPAWAVLAVVMVLGLSVEADAQGVASSPYMSSYRVSDYFASPGWYGTSYGFASYGFPQTYSVFSAYPGPSYGNNYPPTASCRRDSAWASGGRDTPRRDMSTGLRITPRPDSATGRSR